MIKVTPSAFRYADDETRCVKFEVQPIPTRFALSNWGRVRNYIALLKLFLPFIFRRYPVRTQQIILLHV